MAATTTKSLVLLYQPSQKVLGSNVNLSPNRSPVLYVGSPRWKALALGIQCFQGVPSSPVAQTDGNSRSIRPVNEVKVPEKIVPQSVELPISALAIADVIGAGFTAVKKPADSKHPFTTASAEFLALCTEQLGLCQDIVGSPARFTIYIRPAESYSTGQLEFHCIAVYPSHQDEYLVLKQADTLVPISLAEAKLINQEVVEVANGSAILLPMVKDLFLIGFIVVEGVTTSTSPSPKAAKLKPIKPVWPPKKERSPVAVPLSKQQLSELLKIALTLALACVVDQRALLLQKSNMKKVEQIDGLLEQAQAPLQAIRTLSQLMLPQFKRGEISRDLIEDILVQGARMKDVLQQLQNVTKSGPSIIQSSQEWEGNVEELPESKLANENRRLHSHVENSDKIRRQGSLPAAHSDGRADVEAPMPPLTLAPVPEYDITRPCDVAKVLKQLGQAANGLANKRGQNLQITSCSPLYAAVNSASLHRVCSHILETALQHAPRGGYVRADAMRAPGGGVLIIIEDGDLSTKGFSSARAWRGSDLEYAHLGEDFQFVQEIVKQEGGVLRVLASVQKDLPLGGSTYVEIWLPAVPKFDDFQNGDDAFPGTEP